jgi:hypothetical protein
MPRREKIRAATLLEKLVRIAVGSFRTIVSSVEKGDTSRFVITRYKRLPRYFGLSEIANSLVKNKSPHWQLEIADHHNQELLNAHGSWGGLSLLAVPGLYPLVEHQTRECRLDGRSTSSLA